jgi:hypothetical protein
MATERTTHEIKLGIPVRCLRAWRALLSGGPPRVAARGGWWSNDDVTAYTNHCNDRRKLAELRECCPGLVDRREEPRDGQSPIALFRIAAKYDPRRAPERAAAMQGVLL